MLLGTIFQKSLKLRTALSFQLFDPEQQQNLVLRKLLKKAKDTQLGRHFGFEEILKSHDIMKAYSGSLPIDDYNSIYKEWWHKQ
ncbi:MAG: GH3 auxin-responsive promoter family protein, partial [Bacteroidota bacterium]